jgi:hypothetical protein
MKKLLLTIPLILSAETIEVNNNNWNLLGTPYETPIQNLNLKSQEIIWTYDNNGTWGCYQQNTDLSGKCNVISKIDAGNGFWYRSIGTESLTIQASTASQKELQTGWNLVSFTDTKTPTYFNNSIYKSVWTYANNMWYLYTPNNDTIENIGTIQTISPYQGVWINYIDNTIQIGDNNTTLTNGNFETVTNTSTNSLTNIWNISFPIDVSKDYTDVEIAIKYEKIENDGDNDIGEIIIALDYITNGTATTAKNIDLRVIGDSGTQNNGYSYKEQPTLLSTITSLNDGILYINLGTFFTEYDKIVIDDIQSAVTQKAKYKLAVTSNTLTIPNSKTLTIMDMTNYGDDYIQKDGIEGYIQID